jgi:hypothetical protein
MTRSSMQQRAGFCINKRKIPRHVAGRPGYSGEAFCKNCSTVTAGMQFGPKGPMVETLEEVQGCERNLFSGKNVALFFLLFQLTISNLTLRLTLPSWDLPINSQSLYVLFLVEMRGHLHQPLRLQRHVATHVLFASKD